MANTLYYGDNLDVLRRYVADESMPGLGQIGNTDGYEIARASARLLAVLKEWDYCDEAGAPLAITTENVESLPISVLMSASYELSNARLPTPEEVKTRQDFLATSTTHTVAAD